MGGLRGEGAQITTKRSLQKNVLKGSQGEALPHQGLRDTDPFLKTGGKRGERALSKSKRNLQKNVLKGSQGGALSHQGLRDRRSLP